MNPSEAIELHSMALEKVSNYERRRFLFDELLEPRSKHQVGILGPRGAGKTVMLLQLASATENAIYLSLDTVDPDADVFDLVRTLAETYGYRSFFLDEVHYHPGIEATLKKIYDFLQVRLIFTSSMAISLHRSAQDLSRRVRLVSLYPFSYRESHAFRHGELLPRLSLRDIIERRWHANHLRATHGFDEYMRGGLMPFSLEEPDVLPLLENILETIISRDVPKVARLRLDELELMRKMVQFIGRAGIDGISYTSLARHLSITKYKAKQYVDLLEMAFVLQRIFPAGTNVLREPKLLLCLPYRLLYREWAEALGGLREDVCVQALRQAEVPVHYLKSTRGKKTPDYLIEFDEETLVVEVGGRGKGREQFKGVTPDRKLIMTHSDRTDGICWPLPLLGYLV